MERERNVGYDVIRIIAIFSVVVIHGLVPYLSYTDKSSAGFVSAMLISSLCLIGAPLFFVLSGALLLDTQEPITLRYLFKKRMPKQFIPFVIWSVVYIIVKMAMGKVEPGIKPFIALIKEPAHSQFWFMYVLLGIYLLLPLIKALVSSIDKKTLEYLLLLWLIFSLGVRFLDNLSSGAVSVSAHLNFLSFFTYPGYFILGYYLKKHGYRITSGQALLSTVISLAATLLISFAEWSVCLANGSEFYGVAYQSYYCPTLAVSVGGIFVLLSRTKRKGCRFCSVAKRLSECTVGVFYIHMLIMAALELIPPFHTANLFFTFVKILLTYVISYACSLGISYIPFINGLLLGNSFKKKTERVTEDIKR